MVTIAKVQQGVIKFVDREIVPGLSIAEKFIVGTGANLMANRIAPLIRAYEDHPLVKALTATEVLDMRNGVVDIAAVYDAAQPYIVVDPFPVKIPFVDLTLKIGKSEIETLYKYIMEA